MSTGLWDTIERRTPIVLPVTVVEAKRDAHVSGQPCLTLTLSRRHECVRRPRTARATEMSAGPARRGRTSHVADLQTGDTE